jgi:hypothetical protein
VASVTTERHSVDVLGTSLPFGRSGDLRRFRIRLWRAVIFSLFLSPFGAWAANKSLTDSLDGAAKSSYESAKLLYGDHDYEGASAKFRHSHELSKDPRLLWNIAACEKALRHYAKASALVERYLREGGSLLTTDDRARATSLLESMSEFSSRVRLENAPPGARVFVDGVLVGTTPIDQLLLDVGARKIRIEADGFVPFETTLEVPGATEVTVVVELAKATKLQESGLIISASGARDAISIDGRVVGEGSVEVTLAPGSHRVTVTAPGKKNYEQDFQLKPGERRRVDVTLKNASSGKLWPWLVGGAALVAGGVVGGVLMASPRDGAFPAGSLGPPTP